MGLLLCRLLRNVIANKHNAWLVNNCLAWLYCVEHALHWNSKGTGICMDWTDNKWIREGDWRDRIIIFIWMDCCAFFGDMPFESMTRGLSFICNFEDLLRRTFDLKTVR